MIRSFIGWIKRHLTRAPKGRKAVVSGDAYLTYLRSRGCRIGSNVSIIGNARIDDNHCWHIVIGNDVTIAPGAYVLAHDASTKPLTGYTWVAPVRIEDGVFIGAHVVVLPGVTIGARAVVGAGAVVTRDIPPGNIVARVPARVFGTVDQYQALHHARLSTYPRFDSSFTIEQSVSLEMRQVMAERIIQVGGGYVE